MITSYSKMVCRLEYIIGRNCYNYQRGKFFRYPVRYRKNGTVYKCSSIANAPEECIASMYYQFGTNILYIGKAINEIIQFLNQKFDITDFDYYVDDDLEEVGVEVLVAHLERIIGRNCYNKEFRKHYRYPVKYKKGATRYESKGLANITEEAINNLHYDFGDNGLYIGTSLLRVLDYLSSNYDYMDQVLSGETNAELENDEAD